MIRAIALSANGQQVCPCHHEETRDERSVHPEQARSDPRSRSQPEVRMPQRGGIRSLRDAARAHPWDRVDHPDNPTGLRQTGRSGDANPFALDPSASPLPQGCSWTPQPCAHRWSPVGMAEERRRISVAARHRAGRRRHRLGPAGLIVKYHLARLPWSHDAGQATRGKML
jgi:hypothetical protein